MYVLTTIRMAAVNESSNMNWDGKPFWGLVQQKGPWQSTRGDRARASMKDVPTIGGGNGVGGTRHAGHGNHAMFMTPYQINGTGAPPQPSPYAMRSVVMGSVDMKRQTKMGRVKNGLTLAARTPLQNGQKMGVSTRTEGVQHEGHTLGVGPDSPPGAPPIPNQLPDLIQGSPVSDVSMHTASEAASIPPLEATGSFLTQHHLFEQASSTGNVLADQLSTVLRQRRDSDSSDSDVEGFDNMFPGAGHGPPTRPSISLGAARSSRSMSIDSYREMGNFLNLAVRAEEPPITTFTPPRPDLTLSQHFLDEIAAYEEDEKERRKIMMDQMRSGPSRYTFGADRPHVQDIKTGEQRGKKLARDSPPSPIETDRKGKAIVRGKGPSPKRKMPPTKSPIPKPKSPTQPKPKYPEKKFDVKPATGVKVSKKHSRNVAILARKPLKKLQDTFSNMTAADPQYRAYRDAIKVKKEEFKTKKAAAAKRR